MKLIINIVLIVLMLFLASCPSGPFDCDEWANGFRDNSETNIILSKIKYEGSPIYLYGKDAKTGIQTEFYEESGWISKIYQQFKMGDTIVKKKGYYTVTIKRKNKIIIYL